jgi:DNA-binding beta-propeller fold protein YncE
LESTGRPPTHERYLIEIAHTMKRYLKRLSSLAIVIALATLLSSAEAQSQHSAVLQLKTVIPLPRVEGRIDHMDIDLKTQRVFVAALGNNTVEVVSLREGTRIRTLEGFKEPQGVLFLPELDQLYITNGGDGTCAILDATSLKRLKTIESLDDADNIRYDKSSELVYVAYGTGGLAIIDPSKNGTTHLLPPTQHPESFQLETSGNKIYVNVPNEKKIVVFDKAKRETVASWPVKDAEKNYPMALDEQHHLLFVGCRTPARLLVLDTGSGKVISTIPIGGDVDDVFFDARQHLLYVSCGEGVIDVFAQETPKTYKRVEQVSTRTGARTCVLVRSLNLLIVAVPRKGTEDAQLRVYSINSQ